MTSAALLPQTIDLCVFCVWIHIFVCFNTRGQDVALYWQIKNIYTSLPLQPLL